MVRVDATSQEDYLLAMWRGRILGGSSGDQLRLGLFITGLAAIGLAAGGAVADATAPENLALPMPVTSKIAVPQVAPLNLLPDEIRSIDVSKTLHVQIAEEGFLSHMDFASGFSSPPAETATAQLPDAHVATTNLTWDFSQWGSLGLAAENGTGISTLLGDFTPTTLSFAGNARTSAAGLAAHVRLGNGWVTTFSYNADVTQLDLKVGSSPAIGTTSLHGRSYGLSIAKHGLFGDADALGLSVSRPTEDYFGSVSLADAGLESRINLLDRYPGVTLSNAKETDIALGYVTTFFNGALALQANAGYQMNVGGQNGTNSVTVLSRAKINF
ncbi:MAG: hypothetical protein ACJ8EL_08455 [Rhizomicrobium sp.]